MSVRRQREAARGVSGDGDGRCLVLTALSATPRWGLAAYKPSFLDISHTQSAVRFGVSLTPRCAAPAVSF